MAIALGLAAMVGVRAGLVGQAVAIVLLLVAILLLAVVAPPSMRGYAAVALGGFAIGVLSALVFAPSESLPRPPATLDYIEGRIVSDPRDSPSGRYVEVRWSDRAHDSRQSVVFIPPGVDAGRSDWVAVEGRIDATGEDPIFAERVSVLERAGSLELFRRRIRETISERILDRVPGSPGSLALGLLIGDDSGLTRAERDEVRASGLSHLTAVSGSNVAMVIAVVAFALRAAGRRGWVWTGLQILGILVYVWIVGLDPPVVRAAIMGSLALVALALGRPSHLLTLLVLSGAIMAALEPEILGSLSFQLSFLAMVALALVGAWAMRLTAGRQQLVVLVVSPAAAAIATAPLLAARFGMFSLGTIPANIIAGPLVVPATGLAAFVAALPGWAVLGSLAGILLWFLTALILGVADAVASLPFAHWTFAPLEPGQTVAVYLVLAMIAAPLAPEVRAMAWSLRAWARTQPGVAATTALAGLIVLAVLAGIAN